MQPFQKPELKTNKNYRNHIKRSTCWFLAIPNTHSYAGWLTTSDKLLSQGYRGDSLCVFSEFLLRTGTTSYFNALSLKSSGKRLRSSVYQWRMFLIVKATAYKLALAAMVYHTWLMNARIHKGHTKSDEGIILSIKWYINARVGFCRKVRFRVLIGAYQRQSSKADM